MGGAPYIRLKQGVHGPTFNRVSSGGGMKKSPGSTHIYLEMGMMY